MEKFHAKMLHDFKHKNSDSNDTKKRKLDSFFLTQEKEKKLASQPNQAKFHQFVALWTALSLCPCSILENLKLQELIQFAGNVKGELTMPSQNTNRSNVIREAKVLKQAIEEDITNNCLFFLSKHKFSFTKITISTGIEWIHNHH